MTLFQLSYLIHLTSSLSLFELRQQIRPVRHPGGVSAVLVVPCLVFPLSSVERAHKAIRAAAGGMAPRPPPVDLIGEGCDGGTSVGRGRAFSGSERAIGVRRPKCRQMI